MLKVHAQKVGNVTILRLQGRIATGDASMLRNAMLSQLDANALVLDLARVNGIDAGGLGVMLELRELTQSKGILFRLVNVTKLVQQVLEMTCLDAVFVISSEEDVLSDAARRRSGALVETVACA